MDLSSSRQLDYLMEFGGEILAIATFPESHSLIDIVRNEAFIPSRPSVGEPLVLPDGTYIFPLDQSGTFARTYRDFSTATIRVGGWIDHVLGTIDEECIVLYCESDRKYVAAVNFMKGNLRQLFEIPEYEETNADLVWFFGKHYVQTVSIDGVRFREVWTGELFRQFTDAHRVILSAGIALRKVWREDGIVELHCNDLQGRSLFADKFLSHVPLTWICNAQETNLAIVGSHKKVYSLPMLDCIYSDPDCRPIRFSGCSRFAGAYLDDRLLVLSLDERAVSYSLELTRYWSHFEILPGGNLVLLDNRGLSNEKFEWKLARNPNGS